MKKYYYLIKVQYLGFRYHGWQKQPDVKTIHHMVDRTLKYVFEAERKFKTLGSGRTDAMVSAEEAAFELFLDQPLTDIDTFFKDLNYNLPQDIKVIEIREVDTKFNIIQNPKEKEYVYLFAHGQKSHPFCASILTTFRDTLDIELMKEGANGFIGYHNFKNYCTRPSETGVFEREILECEIVENTLYSANFFPEETFLLRVKGHGFLYHQIRLMMGTLVKLGKGQINIKDLKESLKPIKSEHINYIAPASGLILRTLKFNT